MKLRYELIDSHYPEWRGQRFTDLARAEKALAESIPSGRFYLYDRQMKGKVVWTPTSGWLS